MLGYDVGELQQLGAEPQTRALGGERVGLEANAVVDDLQPEDAAASGEAWDVADREHALRMQVRQQAVELAGQGLRHVDELAAREIVADAVKAHVDIALAQMLSIEIA